MEREDIILLARQAAEEFGLDYKLVCAVIEQESNFNLWAVRFEPRFYERYTKPMNLTDTEEYTRAISWGLIQIMGEVARELGFKGKYLAELCLPELNLRYGCMHLANKLRKTDGDIKRALLLWNGGGNKLYPDEVWARVGKF